MYHPTTRLLTILELLQTHPYLSGEELASRLEVESRTVRRYILMLQEMGMPVEGIRGPGGGYRLRPGFKLPPLLFTEEEATAVTLGLLGLSWLEIDLSSVAVEGALAKVYRVLPLRGRERLQAVSSHLILVPHAQDERIDATLLVKFSEAVQERRRIAIEYSSHHNEFTQRQIEPYGVVGWKGHWYVVGYCCLRQGYRTFRLDRVRNVQLLPDIFTRDEDFDYRAYVIKHLTSVPPRWSIEVEFQAEPHSVQQKIPSSYGSLTATSTGVLFRTHHVHLPTMARYLIGLDLPFIIHHPPELCEALQHLAEQMIQIANASHKQAEHQGKETRYEHHQSPVMES
jgi:predicted DNA-binding transcriptional regulator YafY